MELFFLLVERSRRRRFHVPTNSWLLVALINQCPGYECSYRMIITLGELELARWILISHGTGIKRINRGNGISSFRGPLRKILFLPRGQPIRRRLSAREEARPRARMDYPSYFRVRVFLRVMYVHPNISLLHYPWLSIILCLYLFNLNRVRSRNV